MSGFSIRLTHRIMAIGAVGLVGLLAVGAIYEAGSRSQESSRSTAEAARNISTLNSKVATEMLEARRAEKDFQLRRDQAYTKRHAELTAGIVRGLDALKSNARADGLAGIAEK